VEKDLKINQNFNKSMEYLCVIYMNKILEIHTRFTRFEGISTLVDVGGEMDKISK